MQAEKDDWVPQRLAPVPWIRQESSDDATFKQWYDSLRAKDDGHLSLDDRKSDTDNPSKDNVNNPKNGSSMPFQLVPGAHTKEQLRYPDKISSHPSATKSSFHNESTSLLFPLLDKDDLQDKEVSEVQTDIFYSPLDNERSLSSMDGKSKKGLKRAKMLDLGKKVSTKLEEKRRHIEEKSRLIVDKMRGVEKNEATITRHGDKLLCEGEH
ncbi:uncharacterized protein LOC131856321 [Cryptomeria japonica]|uniref:uncharacterized protein LOC131856321 n=1 Tax=Cryptomeria japonica TaxID=3369 RepID=UPI0027DA3259|nr:uncharacterized protein LOC131856321 [Cryptomeria japonica]XP_059063937.1 uncharacterized protein LOC131856321 [Cryptomeria japonica]